MSLKIGLSSRIRGSIEVSYSPQYTNTHMSDESTLNAIEEIILQCGGTDITHHTMTNKNRFADLIYEFRLLKEQDLDNIQERIMQNQNLKGIVENVSTLVVE
jgi:hypothetical protein